MNRIVDVKTPGSEMRKKALQNLKGPITNAFTSKGFILLIMNGFKYFLSILSDYGSFEGDANEIIHYTCIFYLNVIVFRNICNIHIYNIYVFL